VQAPGEELRISFEKAEEEQRPGDPHQADEKPGLPKTKRARRRKQQQAKNCQAGGHL